MNYVAFEYILLETIANALLFGDNEHAAVGVLIDEADLCNFITSEFLQFFQDGLAEPAGTGSYRVIAA